MLSALTALLIQHLPAVLAVSGILGAIFVVYLKGRGDGKAIIRGEVAEAEQAQGERLLDAQAKVQQIEDKRHESIEKMRDLSGTHDGFLELVRMFNQKYGKAARDSSSDKKDS